MRTSRVAVATAAVLALSLSVVIAAEKSIAVTITGAHLCCGKCYKGAEKSLEKAKGISNLTFDKKKKTIAFDATDEKSAKAALAALAKGGFHGKAKAGDKKLKFPKQKIKKGTTSNKFTVSEMHLCCGKCVTGAKKALADVKGIEGDLDISQKTGEITISGADIDLRSAFKALNKAGFHGSLKKK